MNEKHKEHAIKAKAVKLIQQLMEDAGHEVLNIEFKTSAGFGGRPDDTWIICRAKSGKLFTIPAILDDGQPPELIELEQNKQNIRNFMTKGILNAGSANDISSMRITIPILPAKLHCADCNERFSDMKELHAHRAKEHTYFKIEQEGQQ